MVAGAYSGSCLQPGEQLLVARGGIPADRQKNGRSTEAGWTMRFYGNVKGFTYRNVQPLPKSTHKPKTYRCSRCGGYFPIEAFIRCDKEYKQCNTCRAAYNEYEAGYHKRRKDSVPKGYELCYTCGRIKPKIDFFRKARTWKSCNECSERRKRGRYGNL